MARFTNYATLTYSGGATDSNTVTGELLDILTFTKQAVSGSYRPGGRVTYALALVNDGAAPLTGLTITDDLGVTATGTANQAPLNYLAGTVRYYVNGAVQPAPDVTAGPPLRISGITVPAGGSAMLLYEAAVTDYAPLGTEAVITNTATVTGGALTAPVTATATVEMEPQVLLRISKALCPAVITETGRLTYTFVIENTGSLPADAEDAITLTDLFNPRLSAITVTLNGTVLAEGTGYTYQPATGAFATVPGQITVPAAAYAQRADGTWAVTPGTTTLTVSGTV